MLINPFCEKKGFSAGSIRSISSAFVYVTRNRKSRRDFLHRTWNGIGALGLGGILADELLAEGKNRPLADPLAPQRQQLPRKAKHCIFLFMQGGVSQMDSSENKPRLRELHGKAILENPGVSGELQGRLTFHHSCVGSPFKFAQHGQSGRWACGRRLKALKTG